MKRVSYHFKRIVVALMVAFLYLETACCSKAPTKICIRKKGSNICLAENSRIGLDPDPTPITYFPNPQNIVFECVANEVVDKPKFNWYIEGRDSSGMSYEKLAILNQESSIYPPSYE